MEQDSDPLQTPCLQLVPASSPASASEKEMEAYLDDLLQKVRPEEDRTWRELLRDAQWWRNTEEMFVHFK